MAPGAIKPYTPPAMPEGRIKLTDPDSKVVKGLRGWIQGFNAQAVTNEHQIVLAAEVETAGADFGHLEPMLDAARRELPSGRRRPTRPASCSPTPATGTCDRWSAIVDQRHTGRSPDTSTRKPAASLDGGHYDFMRRVLADRARRRALRRAPAEDRAHLRPNEFNRASPLHADAAEAPSAPSGG